MAPAPLPLKRNVKVVESLTSTWNQSSSNTSSAGSSSQVPTVVTPGSSGVARADWLLWSSRYKAQAWSCAFMSFAHMSEHTSDAPWSNSTWYVSAVAGLKEKVVSGSPQDTAGTGASGGPEGSSRRAWVRATRE